MKFLKNKFIFSIVLIIFVIIGFETYSFYSKIDTNSYVTLISGEGFLNDSKLDKKERYLLKVGNTVKTVGQESIAVIEWGDSSITRLGGDTQIIVNENYISSDLTIIKISLNLINGKTWNNLVSIFGKDSYFKQYVDDVEAGVRGTIFEINKEKDYIYVENHQITLKNTQSNQEITIPEKTPIKLSSLSLIELQEFLSILKDKTWEEINKKLDKEMILNLKNGLSEQLKQNNPINFILSVFSKRYSVIYDINRFYDIEKVKFKISKLNNSDKKYIYNKIFSKYQAINFLKPEDENYDKKIYYKEILLSTSYDEKNTESLIKNSLYDINDMVSSNNLSNLKSSIDLLLNNKDKIKSLNIDFNQYVDIKNIPENLKDSMIKSLEPLKEILNINLDIESLLDLEKKASDKVNQFLEKNVGGLIESIKNNK